MDILTQTLSNWINIDYLHSFFAENSQDLGTYFKITNLDDAIYDTVADTAVLSCLILDINPEANLNELKKMETVRNYLIAQGVLDREGLVDYNNEQA